MFDGKFIHKWSIFHSDAASYRIIKYYDCNHKQMKIHMHIYTHMYILLHISIYKYKIVLWCIMPMYVQIYIHLHIWFPHVSPCLQHSLALIANLITSTQLLLLERSQPGSSCLLGCLRLTLGNWHAIKGSTTKDVSAAASLEQYCNPGHHV